MVWFLTIIIFLFGLSIGSFLNVCIYRLPKGKSIVFPRSFCPGCGKKIAGHDNIPLLSYLLLRGKCRSCRASISLRYPLVELVTGLLFVAAHFYVLDMRGCLYRVGLVELSLFTVPFFWYFIASLIALTLIDWEHFILPDRITYPLIVVGLLFAFLLPEHFCLFQWKRFVEFNRWWGLVYSLIGLAAGGVSIWAIGLLGKKVFKKEAMGFGDVVLMAGVGAWQGWQMVLLAIFLGALSASVFYLPLIAIKKAKWDSKLPFGPYLALGSLLTLFFGRKILFWYLQLYAR